MKEKFPLILNGVIIYDTAKDHIRIDNINPHIAGLITNSATEKVFRNGKPIKEYSMDYHLALAEKYPKVAAFKIKLYHIYKDMGEDYEFLEKFLVNCCIQNPESLLLKTNLAELYFKEEQLQKAINVFGVGEDITLKKVYPKRTEYMKNEYLIFCSALAFINVSKANIHFKIRDMKTQAKYMKKALVLLAKMMYLDQYHFETKYVKKILRVRVTNVQDN